MSLFVDTSVWSLAWRRDAPSDSPEVERLAMALSSGEQVFTTGLVLQELLQGFRGPKVGSAIIERFNSLPLLVPDRTDHVEAAELRNRCRRGGVQIGTVDALLAQLAIRRELVLLSTDKDFQHAARLIPLKIWNGVH